MPPCKSQHVSVSLSRHTVKENMAQVHLDLVQGLPLAFMDRYSPREDKRQLHPSRDKRPAETRVLRKPQRA